MEFNIFAALKLMEFGAVYLWALRAQKWPLETVKRRENRASPATERQQNGVTLRPPIKGRIPPINGSTPLPFIGGLSSRVSQGWAPKRLRR